jgi:hypothetical protein
MKKIYKIRNVVENGDIATCDEATSPRPLSFKSKKKGKDAREISPPSLKIYFSLSLKFLNRYRQYSKNHIFKKGDNSSESLRQRALTI